MDTKDINEFKPRAMRSEFQTRLRDELPRRQFEDFASEAGSDDDKRCDSDDDKRCDESFATVSVPSESPTKSDADPGIDTALTPTGPTSVPSPSCPKMSETLLQSSMCKSNRQPAGHG